ncbi:MAG: hypothetical protein ACREX0_09815 [Noviherbaspirillum sp.]
MNKFIGLFVVCVASNAFAQANNVATTLAPNADLVEFVSLEQMPLPIPKSEVEKMQKLSSAKAIDGFSSTEKSPEMVRGFFHHMNTAKTLVANRLPENAQQQKGGKHSPEVHKDLSNLKLAFKAASFNRGTLVAAAPSGTQIDNAWTGVERFFQIEGAGSVRLSEFDLGATKGKFYMLKDAVNTRVNGKPAISKVFTDDDGQSIEEVVWVSGNKFYMFTFGPDIVPGSKVKAAAHISAHTLAQELR